MTEPAQEEGTTLSREAWARVLEMLRRFLAWTSRPGVRRGITAALSLVAIGGIVAILYTNWDTLKAIDWQLRPVPLLLSFPAYSLALAFAVVGWGKLMLAVGSTASWPDHARVYCVSNLARRIPGVLWHVMGRIALYDNKEASVAAISLASGLELLLVAVSGLIIGLIAWPGMVLNEIQPIWVVVGIGAGLILIHPRVLSLPMRWLHLSRSDGTELELRYRQVLGWLLLQGGSWVAGGIVLFCLMQAIYPVPMHYLPQTIGAWSLSGMIAVIAAFLPVGFGLRELALGLLLSTFLPSGPAIVVAILMRLLLIVYELVWALLIHLLVRVAGPVVPK